MFGFVVANQEKLSPGDKDIYKSCYCGLCRSLGKRHGNLSRLTINYDMTFIILVLSSLYEEDYKRISERCMVHPVNKHTCRFNGISDYAADMNIVLAYFNFIDDWNDDKKLHSLIEAKLLEKAYRRVHVKYPDQCGNISAYLKELLEIEKSGELNPDIPANCFGKLMAEVVSFRKDNFSHHLRAFGTALGKFIYIMDACIDLKKDIKKESYNPMITTSSENFSTILNLLMADCVEKYRKLPIERHKDLIENILYSGVWTRFEAEKKRSKESNLQ